MTIAALRCLLDELQPHVVRPPAPQLSPRKTHPRSKETYPVNVQQAVTLSMHSDGYSDQQIADRLGIDIKEVTETIDADKAQKAAGPGTTADEAAPAEETETASEPPAEEIPELADLLVWAAAHSDDTVRADGEGAAAVLLRLRERRARDAELDEITNEESQLEERLAALRARKSTLEPQPAGAKRKPQRDYDPRVVRAWARDHGHDVPERARIPRRVLDAWRHRDSAPGTLSSAG